MNHAEGRERVSGGARTPEAVAGRRRPGALILACAVALAVAAAGTAAAQTPEDVTIRDLIARLDSGETEAVRQQLPDLVARFQNHPGMLFLQARLATDGIESAKLYQSVLDNYPASEWADDALFNLYQYYYAMGLYKTAELKMQQLRKEYPASEHLRGKTAQTVAPDSLPAAPTAAGEIRDRRDAPGRDTGETPARDTGYRSEPVREPAAERLPAAETPTAPEPVPALQYALQTGAFSTSENARKQKEWLEDRGYTAEITNRVRGGRSLYLVWTGSYRTRDEARAALAEIQSRYNITPIVVER
jgi:cell division septation protein DedD